MSPRLLAASALALALGAACTSRGGGEARKQADANPAPRVDKGAEPRVGDLRLAPIDAGEAKSTHGPYASGACEACHERHDAANPGRAVKADDAACVGCHEEFAAASQVRLDRAVHPASQGPCTGCHNPHNARKPKLQM
jgi:predicted CXXCH cytochrome family protein